jgi:hypothetical protein
MRTLIALILTSGLVLAGCDSGGSNSEDSPSQNTSEVVGTWEGSFEQPPLSGTLILRIQGADVGEVAGSMQYIYPQISCEETITFEGWSESNLTYAFVHTSSTGSCSQPARLEVSISNTSSQITARWEALDDSGANGTHVLTRTDRNDDSGDDGGNGNMSRWTALGGGTGGARLSEVYALALGEGDDVYIGGDFPNAGGVLVNRIARWDGSSWSALAAGLSGRVNALVVDDQGILYAGGAFLSSGSTVLGNLARWDGQTWNPIGGGVTACFVCVVGTTVNALALSTQGDLYVAGNDVRVGINPDGTRVPASGVIKWNGSEWSAVADPNVDAMQEIGGVAGDVNTIILDGSGGMYAGGSFVKASGKRVNNLAYWDGKTWNELGGGVDGSVYSLVLNDNGDLVVSGSFNSAGNIVADNMVQWNGSGWSRPFAAKNPAAQALAYGPDGRLYAGGYFSGDLVSRWTGTKWEGIGSGILLDRSPLTTMQFDLSGYLYVGGNFGAIDGVEANGVARWDGVAN